MSYDCCGDGQVAGDTFVAVLEGIVRTFEHVRLPDGLVELLPSWSLLGIGLSVGLLLGRLIAPPRPAAARDVGRHTTPRSRGLSVSGDRRERSRARWQESVASSWRAIGRCRVEQERDWLSRPAPRAAMDASHVVGAEATAPSNE
ncbi:hypothetical protein KM043_017017 [Ampulex compressa]|nr:hypothetical protein KM043_017017 [Ampulex compressa]